MTDVEPVATDFASSGRAGRRNALPDILGSPTEAETSELPPRLAELSLSKDGGAEGGEKSSSETPVEDKVVQAKNGKS
ncbi:cAMP-dependent protein kinase inhibitor beta [Microcaecilia unicolor]|uniref:cAMP-dependent protein kinase inhibitor beta n=1 Tax=Microcaecilia unicolor TaxID=1415580 RepID=A0A6P7XFZ5_9AMPH|nr:cAMP-dependent protein kinase inhibitor beta [Microcaecilia unicolor]